MDRQTMSYEPLSDVDLSQPWLTYWHMGECTHYSGAEFWGLVQSYIDWIDSPGGLPGPQGGVTLVVGHSSPHQMALFIAVISTGRQAALFPPNAPLQDEAAFFEQQRQSLAKVNPAALCVFEPKFAQMIKQIDPSLGERTHLMGEPSPSRSSDGSSECHARDLLRARLACTTPIFIQHSSGTTGIKKAVGVSGTALVGQFRSYWPMLRKACGAERLSIASWLPLYHDMGLLTSFLLPLLGGDHVSIVDAFEWISRPSLLLEMIERDQCSVVWQPNFAYRHLVRLRPSLEQRRLESVRLWIDCSEPCRLTDANAFERSFADWGVTAKSVVGCYAMAETVFAATQCMPAERRALAVPHAVLPGTSVAEAGARVVQAESEVDPGGDKLVLSSGRLLAGLELAVLVDEVPQADGIYGELALRGHFVFDGYSTLSRAESAIRDDGFFRTGDLGAVIDGHVYVFGRLKEIIIVNGKNLFAGDIESTLGAIAGVRKGRVVAFGMDSPQTGSEELIVVAEHDPAANAPPAEIRQAVSRLVADTFMIKPRDVRIVDERWLVKSTSGKISRDENRRKYIQTFRTKAL